MVKEKTVLLVRHPSYMFLDGLFSDMPTDPNFRMPLDAKGTNQAIAFEKELARILRQFEGKKVEFISSPYKRTMSMARIVLSFLKRDQSKHPEIPLPKEIKELVELSEIPSGLSKKEYRAANLRRQNAGESYFGIWVSRLGLKTIAMIFDERRSQQPKVFRALKKSDADIIVVFSHVMTMATQLWNLKHKGRDARITEKNLMKVIAVGKNIANASFIELRMNKAGRLTVKGVPIVRHLPANLRTGIYKMSEFKIKTPRTKTRRR